MVLLIAACMLSCSWILNDIVSKQQIPKEQNPFEETNNGSNSAGLLLDGFKMWSLPSPWYIISSKQSRMHEHRAFINETQDSITVFFYLSSNINDEDKELPASEWNYFWNRADYGDGDVFSEDVIRYYIAKCMVFSVPLSEVGDGAKIPIEKIRVAVSIKWVGTIGNHTTSEYIRKRRKVMLPRDGEMIIRKYQDNYKLDYEADGVEYWVNQLSGNFHFSGTWGEADDAPGFSVTEGTFDSIVYKSDPVHPVDPIPFSEFFL